MSVVDIFDILGKIPSKDEILFDDNEDESVFKVDESLNILGKHLKLIYPVLLHMAFQTQLGLCAQFDLNESRPTTTKKEESRQNLLGEFSFVFTCR